MEALATARHTDLVWRFETNGEHPCVRLTRLVGDPTERERVALAQALANVSAKEWARAELGFQETYIARAQFVFNVLAEHAMGQAA